jgi:hypothetical protein
MKIGTGIQVILRFCFGSFRGSNAGNGLRCHDVHTKFIKIDPGIQKSLGGRGIRIQTQQGVLISLRSFLVHFPCFEGIKVDL